MVDLFLAEARAEQFRLHLILEVVLGDNLKNLAIRTKFDLIFDYLRTYGLNRKLSVFALRRSILIFLRSTLRL